MPPNGSGDLDTEAGGGGGERQVQSLHTGAQEAAWWLDRVRQTSKSRHELIIQGQGRIVMPLEEDML